MTKIVLREEAKPHPKPEGGDQLYNSPPSFEGRYILVNDRDRPIQGPHFSIMKQNNLIHYWDREWLEDMDMFYDEEGYRLDTKGIDYLRKQGYIVEIITLEQQKEFTRKYYEEKRKSEEVYEKWGTKEKAEDAYWR